MVLEEETAKDAATVLASAQKLCSEKQVSFEVTASQ